ncbi:MAG: indolepyruvate/phenylpyruvate decarboxylase [Gammaproteobacteria bacterium]|uniref:indolepyruvate/phenylpyruvate decarboxylase n=1 Tax=Rhodoferax sp. TaxID=50421 RepID=UPI0017C7AEFA|nr:indolepyruvate/phenylpyruvate decarboxylase [Rhodoferax sp.]MBU3898264.1 indolepyruvate/phenylpyruvate decarboxylase [Gammaproteobacteria bacterium]MBA3059038.1 indolepyruvate/phenylpyruvate decarboxylase [Rhodoferax sp.]MBU3997014.1 indolepyruvate/phenylpyruvate decarboxylase [Gammaproteobacteria bacterium]MBU4081449.1 indolepyruvate/phenylpyruvate decarboxylase [Gammaproteobacteria bacterium]MBU4114228.1 indolepyruvate/phenylpyruvate decarboxylase [Gammaproteobacteria bacterium]
MNLTESLLHALKAHGAQQIFGIPGDFALPYFRIIEQSAILPLYTLSHEPGVGFAADACGRINGGLGVAAVTYGAGAFNMVNAVASAYAERSPLVVLSGGPGKGESQSGFLLHHQAKTLDSQFQIFKEITCDQVRLDDAERAPADIARALANCLRHSQPVYIEIPRDMVAEPCLPVMAEPAPAVDPDALDACVTEILQRLGAASAPVLMVGVEVRRFGLEAKVAELSRRLALPVVTSFMGIGLLAQIEAPLVGTYLGVAGLPEVTQLVENSDGLFLLGVIVSDTNFAVSEKKIDMRKTIGALAGQVTMGYHTYSHIPLVALVDRLLERVPATDKKFSVKRQTFPHGLVADAAPITPTDIATAVNDLMAVHGKLPIASDMGDCLFTALDIEHTALIAPGYYATMGFGVPAGLGLQAATGERPLILVGDGAFQMTGWELGNCRRYGWDPIVLVFNNASWEMLRTFQPESDFNDLDHWGFADMAAGMGGDGVRVNTRAELKAALDKAITTRGRFQLIDITIPRGVLSETLSRFVAGVKRLSA